MVMVEGAEAGKRPAEAEEDNDMHAEEDAAAEEGDAEAEEKAGNLKVLRDYLKMEHGVAGEVMEALGSFGKD